MLHRTKASVLRWLVDQNPDLDRVRRHLVTNRRGLVDWRLANGKGIFDAIAPQVAYRDWVSDDRVESSATIIVGCNLGYGVNHVLATTPVSHKVLVLEPRPEMILACLSQTDYGPFLENQKLVFIPPDHQHLAAGAWQLALQYVYGNIFLRSDIPSRQLGPDYAVWFRRVREALEDMSCLVTTMRHKQHVMVRNELRNFARAMEDGSLLPLKDQGQGITAVVLGAGPSLANFAPALAKNPATALYVAGFQTLPALQEYGLKPHFCMAVDHTAALKKTYARLDAEWIKTIPLIYSCAIDPEVLRIYPGPTIPLWTLGGLGSNMPRDREFVLDAGGNVGVAITRFLVWCGVDKVVLVGQDFAWQGRHTHVAGHLSEQGRFEFDPSRHVAMKNRDNQTIFSDLAYLVPLRTMERDIQQWDTPVFNLYGGGAVIKGAKEVTWQWVQDENVLTSYPGRRDRFLEKMMSLRFPRCWPVFESRIAQWIESLKAAENRLVHLFARANRNQSKIRHLLNQVLSFLRQDPLYQPYLFNEILAVAGLVHCKSSYGMSEFHQCQEILKETLKKIAEIDRYLIDNRMPAAA
jgi:hypothetical protein